MLSLADFLKNEIYAEKASSLTIVDVNLLPK